MGKSSNSKADFPYSKSSTAFDAKKNAVHDGHQIPFRGDDMIFLDHIHILDYINPASCGKNIFHHVSSCFMIFNNFSSCFTIFHNFSHFFLFFVILHNGSRCAWAPHFPHFQGLVPAPPILHLNISPFWG